MHDIVLVLHVLDRKGEQGSQKGKGKQGREDAGGARSCLLGEPWRWKKTRQRSRDRPSGRRRTTRRSRRSGRSSHRVPPSGGKTTRPRYCFSACARSRPRCTTPSGGATSAAAASTVSSANLPSSTMKKNVSVDGLQCKIAN